MSADHHRPETPNPQPDTGQQRELPKHPFTQALETWDAWSMAHTMRLALQKARQQGDQDTLAQFERYPEWTDGPGPLEALRANHEAVETLTGWRWQAMREAREQGHGWGEIARTLRQSADQARVFYLDKVEGQRRLAQELPELGYDPGWLELAKPNDADRAARAELERRALSFDDPGCPPDNGGRDAGHER
jgi:hypothetical protein